MGRRVKKTVYAYGSGEWELEKEILFAYDGWNLIQEKEVSATGDPLFDKFYVWGLDLSQSLQGAGGIGGLVCRVSGGEVRHYFYDANGNVGQLVNPEDGAVTARYEYDLFGKTIIADGIGAAGNAVRFSTKYWDEETDLVYYGFRFYVPELGRWTNRDPLGEYGGINLYTFSANNAVNLFDILGLACDLPDVFTTAVKGCVAGYIKTVAIKKVVTTGVKVVASQAAPVVGQAAGIAMSAWEVYSFGRTAYVVYVNSNKIRESLETFYNDPEIIKWIKCLPEDECNKLADQLGELIGSLVANRKEVNAGIQKIKDLIKSFGAQGKRNLGNGVGTVGRDISDLIEISKKKLHRPYKRKAFREQVKAAAPKTADGKFIDPNTKQGIEGKYQYGHIYGYEHRRLVKEAEAKEMTQQEFNDWVNDHPEWFQIEDPISNMSHKFEKPGG